MELRLTAIGRALFDDLNETRLWRLHAQARRRLSSSGTKPATGDSTNLQSASVKAGSSITLNAVVEPIMSQITLFMPGIYGADPRLFSVGQLVPGCRKQVLALIE
jgi:hypothetical protein